MSKPHEWHCEALRFTFFGPSVSGGTPAPLWASIVGAEPDSSTAKPKEGFLLEQGGIQSMQLQMVQQPGRVDVVLQPGEASFSFPDLGRFDVVLEAFGYLAKLPIAASSTRVAFGATLHCPTSTNEESYEVLRDMLPSVRLEGELSDLLFQINRPVTSRLRSDIKLVRLSKWAAKKAEFVSLIERDTIYKTLYAAHLELDINTSFETPIPSGTDIFGLFDELTHHAVRIAAEGDHQ